MATPYFDDALGAGIIGGNLLALPNTLDQQWQQAHQNAGVDVASMAQQLGVPPELLQQAFPTQASGLANVAHSALQVPVLGSILKGVGGLGQVLQMITGGGGAPAPRPPLEQLKDYAALRKLKTAEDRDVALDQYRKDELQLGRDRLTETIKRDDTQAVYRTQMQKDREAKTSGTEDPKTAFQLWRRDNPQGTFADYSKAQTGAAVDKTQAVQKIKDVALTTATKTMIERAPRVISLVDRVEKRLSQVETGPLASRYQEAMTTGVGAKNPEFAQYLADLVLLRSALTQMHFGARGGGQFMHEEMLKALNGGVQSPENMRAALEEIRDYAHDVAGTGRMTTDAGTASPSAEQASPGGGTTTQSPSTTTTTKVPVTSDAIKQMAERYAADVNAGRMTADEAKEALRNILNDPSFK